MWESIVLGVASGGVVALAGYFKNYNKSDFKGFDKVKAGRTLIIGMISGLLVTGFGFSSDNLSIILESAGVTVVIENLLKGFFNRFSL